MEIWVRRANADDREEVGVPRAIPAATHSKGIVFAEIEMILNGVNRTRSSGGCGKWACGGRVVGIMYGILNYHFVRACSV